MWVCADVSYVLIFWNGQSQAATTFFFQLCFHVFCAFLQNLPADALPDGPVREKMANFKRPKKFKTSENDFSHGSFFLRIGGISKSIYPNFLSNLQVIRHEINL